MDDLERTFPGRELSRRDFLKLSGIILAGLSLNWGCGKPLSQDRELAPDVFRLEKPPPPTGEAVASIVRSKDIAYSVKRAIELAGGLGEIKQGDRVVIKPNMTTGYAAAARVTTHPEVLRAVIRAVKEKGRSAARSCPRC